MARNNPKERIQVTAAAIIMLTFSDRDCGALGYFFHKTGITKIA